MDYERIKRQANDILLSQSAECTYIEYKASSKQFDKLLKTLCAYGNNYYLFIYCCFAANWWTLYGK